MTDVRGRAHTTTILSGVDALVRLLVVRRQIDRRAGLNTATMVSGYPGSPLGGLDLAIENATELLGEHAVVHRPGLNEELAAATVWGSQMGAAIEYAGVDGVAGAWYGKTPGLDRSGDVIKHANAMGAGPNGGVVMFCGDDPSAKSSTLTCDSQHTFEDACMPVLYPGDQQDVVDLGVHAFAMSRYAGAWVGMKVVTAVADGIGSVELDPDRFHPTDPPAVEIDGRPWRHHPQTTIGPHAVADQEVLVVHHRLAAAQAYARHNGLDRTVGAGSGARLGIVCAGKTYFDVIQAFADLGVHVDDLGQLGVRVLKLAMTFPVVPEIVVDFAGSVDELVVIEEKRPFIETQVRSLLHEARSPVPVMGKRDGHGQVLASSVGELDVAAVGAILGRVLPALVGRREPVPATPRLIPQLEVPSRPPAFCSGCPHNRSTVAPVGALVGGGVGCHGIMYFEPRQAGLKKLPPTPMGAEGVPWIGLSPFVAEPHLIQNIGDGTLSHSGTLAIRASVAAGVDITFKVLYNSAVAMTGGQDVTGLMDIPSMTRGARSRGGGADRGVRRGPPPLRPPGPVGAGRGGGRARRAGSGPGGAAAGLGCLGHRVRPALRGRGPAVAQARPARGAAAPGAHQRGGVRGLRRLQHQEQLPVGAATGHRVRGEAPDRQPVVQPRLHVPRRRLPFVRHADAPTGATGDLPTTTPPTATGSPAVAQRPVLPTGTLPAPSVPAVDEPYGVYFTGIGGTGVVTANRILAAAAEVAGFVVGGMDQTGLSQKAGAVVSHLHLATDRDALASATISPGGADLYLSGDLLQAASPTHLAKVRPDATIAVVDTSVTPTAAMLQTDLAAPDPEALQQAIAEAVGADRVCFVDSTRIAQDVFANPLLANVVMLGAAFQRGGLPLSVADIEVAMARQGRTAADNRQAFEWGRWAAHDQAAVDARLVGAVREDRPSQRIMEPSARGAGRGAVDGGSASGPGPCA